MTKNIWLTQPPLQTQPAISGCGRERLLAVVSDLTTRQQLSAVVFCGADQSDVHFFTPGTQIEHAEWEVLNKIMFWHF